MLSNELGSVIFSVWKRTIDLLGEALSKENIPFLRIDGSDVLSKRKQKLSEFESGTHASVLLMTLGTGAVG